MPSICIIGFGKLGQFIATWIKNESERQRRNNDKESERLRLRAVYTRRPVDLTTLPDTLATWLQQSDLLFTQSVGEALADCDVAVEVASPAVYRTLAPALMARTAAPSSAPCTFFMGSPAALGHITELTTLVDSVEQGGGGGRLLLGVPSGAAWGVADVRAMARRGKVARVRVTMEKHPSSLKIVPSAEGGGACGDAVARAVATSLADGRRVEVYRGPVGPLTAAAPQNVNTMSVLALASLGFADTEGVLVADPTLTAHDICIDVWGKPTPGHDADDVFHVSTTRHNPAAPGAVTGSATYHSFVASLDRLLDLHERGFDGLHFC